MWATSLEKARMVVQSPSLAHLGEAKQLMEAEICSSGILNKGEVVEKNEEKEVVEEEEKISLNPKLTLSRWEGSHKAAWTNLHGFRLHGYDSNVEESLSLGQELEESHIPHCFEEALGFHHLMQLFALKLSCFASGLWRLARKSEEVGSFILHSQYPYGPGVRYPGKEVKIHHLPSGGSPLRTTLHGRCNICPWLTAWRLRNTILKSKGQMRKLSKVIIEAVHTARATFRNKITKSFTRIRELWTTGQDEKVESGQFKEYVFKSKTRKPRAVEWLAEKPCLAPQTSLEQ
ncbi:hypothetical protein U0070_022141, partial [Myodes glareolus]